MFEPTGFDVSDKVRRRECFCILHALGFKLADAYKLAGFGTDKSARTTMRVNASHLRSEPFPTERLAYYRNALHEAAVVNRENKEPGADHMTASEALSIASAISRDVGKASINERMTALKLAISLGKLDLVDLPKEGDGDNPDQLRPGDPEFSRKLNAAAQMAIQRMDPRTTDDQSAESQGESS